MNLIIYNMFPAPINAKIIVLTGTSEIKEWPVLVTDCLWLLDSENMKREIERKWSVYHSLIRIVLAYSIKKIIQNLKQKK